MNNLVDLIIQDEIESKLKEFKADGSKVKLDFESFYISVDDFEFYCDSYSDMLKILNEIHFISPMVQELQF